MSLKTRIPHVNAVEKGIEQVSEIFMKEKT